MGKMYRLTISQLSTDIPTDYHPTIDRVFDSLLSDTLAKYRPSPDSLPSISSGYRPSIDHILCELSAKCHCTISEVFIWWTIKLCGLIYWPVHLDQYNSRVSNWPTVNWYTCINRLRLRTLHCGVQSWLHSIASCLYFQTDKLLKEILDSATSLLFELICVVHQVRSGVVFFTCNSRGKKDKVYPCTVRQ